MSDSQDRRERSPSEFRAIVSRKLSDMYDICIRLICACDKIETAKNIYNISYNIENLIEYSKNFSLYFTDDVYTDEVMHGIRTIRHDFHRFLIQIMYHCDLLLSADNIKDISDEIRILQTDVNEMFEQLAFFANMPRNLRDK